MFYDQSSYDQMYMNNARESAHFLNLLYNHKDYANFEDAS